MTYRARHTQGRSWGRRSRSLRRIQDNDRNRLVAAVAGLRHGVHFLLSHLRPALGLQKRLRRAVGRLARGRRLCLRRCPLPALLRGRLRLLRWVLGCGVDQPPVPHLVAEPLRLPGVPQHDERDPDSRRVAHAVLLALPDDPSSRPRRVVPALRPAHPLGTIVRAHGVAAPKIHLELDHPSRRGVRVEWFSLGVVQRLLQRRRDVDSAVQRCAGVGAGEIDAEAGVLDGEDGLEGGSVVELCRGRALPV